MKTDGSRKADVSAPATPMMRPAVSAQMTGLASAAFFVIDGVSPFELRAKLLPLLRQAGIPLEDESDEQPGPSDAAASQGSAYSLGDELAKLAQLHERGVLTDAELAAAKAKLLS
jgi:hypothetical protein